MLTECPHCLRKVLLLRDTVCPSCHLDTTDLVEVDPDKTTLTIGENDILPDMCCSCAGHTTRRVKIRVARSSDHEAENEQGDSNELAHMLGYLIGGPFGLLIHAASILGKRSAPAVTVVKVNLQIKIPQCHYCSKEEKVQPLFIDYDYFEMKFSVHKDFKQKFKELNEES